MLQQHSAAGLLMALALLVASCETRSHPPSSSLAIPIARLQTTSATVLTGIVRAPLGMVPEARALRLAALAEAPLAGATVSLTGLDGTPLPGLGPQVTDASGRYRFGGVPVGRTLLVQVNVQTADGRTLRLLTLVTTRDAELEADISAGTTVLAAATLRQSDGSEPTVDPTAFLEASTLIEQALTASDADRLESPDLMATGAWPCELRRAVAQVLPTDTLLDCEASPVPSPTPTPRRGGGGRGGGGSSGGGPATGSLVTDLTIQDGPILAATPTPTPTETPSETPIATP